MHLWGSQQSSTERGAPSVLSWRASSNLVKARSAASSMPRVASRRSHFVHSQDSSPLASDCISWCTTQELSTLRARNRAQLIPFSEHWHVTLILQMLTSSTTQHSSHNLQAAGEPKYRKQMMLSIKSEMTSQGWPVYMPEQLSQAILWTPHHCWWPKPWTPHHCWWPKPWKPHHCWWPPPLHQVPGHCQMLKTWCPQPPSWRSSQHRKVMCSGKVFSLVAIHLI